jgi:hypothetical protein
VVGGRYALRTAIGHGGMGTVWRATDTVLRRDVAVKEVLLPPGMAPVDRDSMYQRTLREARAAAGLSHPAVVQVYDVVTDGGRPWIVMELLQSRSLAEMIVEDGPLAPRAVAKIGIALLGALEVAHAAGVLHRDVKPANVLISSDGRCVLTDFGVARMPTDAELTSPGMVLGSPHFISPERAVGASFGPPSDLFSLGVTLYTAVEGRPPFDKSDPFETMRAVVEEPPQPAMRAGALSGVLYGLLEKNPDRRWDVETARSVLRELLVGPLASNPTTHFTDPYAVVRPAPFTPPTASPPSGQIGGSAMLAPGETVTDALRRRGLAGGAPGSPAVPAPTGPIPGQGRESGAPAGPVGPSRPNGSAGASPAARTAPPPRRPAVSSPADQTDPAGLDAAGPQGGGLTDTAGMAVSGLDVDVLHTGAIGPAQNPGAAPGTGPIPSQPIPAQGGYRPGGGRHAAPGAGDAGRNGAASNVARTAVHVIAQGATSAASAARPAARRGMDIAGRWSPVTKAACAVVGALLLLLSVLGITALIPSGGTGGQQRAMAPQPSAAAPAFAVQEHKDPRGFTVNVPKDWTRKTSNSSFVDYVDPNDNGRRLRLNIEKATGTATGFAEVAEGQLKKNTGSCAAPYNRVGLRDGNDVKLGGQQAAELEYTCGSGDQTRHGIWRVVVQKEQAFQFFLTVPDSQFAASKPIYDEMVRSYRLGA